MRKKLMISILVILLLGLVILLVMNARYPFYTPVAGNWSVGIEQRQTLDGEINPQKIISYAYIDSLVPEPIDYIADPFFIYEKDTLYLFVELKGRGNANIALLTSSDGKSFDYKGIVLDEEFHLSYPQVFKHQDQFFMLPGTKGSNSILLYTADSFPYDWKVIDTLLQDIALKDTSILLSDTLNLIVAVDDDLRQYMFSADSLKGKWKEVRDYKSRWGNEARPGGRFFELNGDWHLPLQNRSLGYGTGVSLYRLKRGKKGLEFQLAEKFFLEPQDEISWFNRGMHHLDVQQVDEEYYLVYDGDRSLDNKKEFQYKRTLKFNYIDFHNYVRDLFSK